MLIPDFPDPLGPRGAFDCPLRVCLSHLVSRFTLFLSCIVWVACKRSKQMHRRTVAWGTERHSRTLPMGNWKTSQDPSFRIGSQIDKMVSYRSIGEKLSSWFWFSSSSQEDSALFYCFWTVCFVSDTQDWHGAEAKYSYSLDSNSWLFSRVLLAVLGTAVCPYLSLCSFV